MEKTARPNPRRRWTAALLALALPCAASAAPKSSEKKDDAETARAKAEALEKKREEQALIRAQFAFGFNDIADKIVIIECEGARGGSAGSGFIAKMNGKPYIFTNQHVIMGADKIAFTTASGQRLAPKSVELSSERDIARLEVDAQDGLEIGPTVAMGIPVAVFGNSEGAGVATELYGTVNGVGAELVETSAEFVSGNSGSPVLNLDRQVLGIASYVRVSRKHAMKEGTEFENKTRRFCYRLTGVEWQAVNWKQYNDKFGKTCVANEALVDSIFDIIQDWFKDPFSKVAADDHPDTELRKWSSSHNLMVNRIVRLNDKGRATPHELDNTNKQIRKDIGDSAATLSAACKQRSRQMRLLATQRDLSGYLRGEFEGYAASLDNAAAAIDRFGAKLSDINFFSFKDEV